MACLQAFVAYNGPSSGDLGAPLAEGDDTGSVAASAPSLAASDVQVCHCLQVPE